MDVNTDPAIQEAFSKLSELEKDFAAVELDARMSHGSFLHTSSYELKNWILKLLDDEC